MTAIAGTDAHVDAQRLFRGVMGRFATGVTVVTTRVGDEIYGMTANAFMAASLEPMLCVVSINHTAQMHARLLAERHFGVSFLTQDLPLGWPYGGLPVARGLTQRTAGTDLPR